MGTRHAGTLRALACAALAIVGVVAAAPPARAQSCAERLGFVEQSLRGAAGPARVWSWSWGVGYTVVGAAQLGIAPFLEDSGRRADFYVGGARTLLAAVPFVVLPLAVMREQRTLSARVASLPPEADRCAELAAAERALERSAASERRGKRWVKHLLVIGVNVTAGLVLGLGFDRWPTGALTAGVGIAVGEIMILTQPTRSVEALRRYRAGARSAPGGSAVGWGLAPTVFSDGAGIGLVVVF